MQIKAMVVEEINTELETNKVQHLVRKCMKMNGAIDQLDALFIKYISKIHIIEIQECYQMIFYPHLERNIHYSISSKDEINSLLAKASEYKIDYKYYSCKENHLNTEDNSIIVINNLVNLNVFINDIKFNNIISSFRKGKLSKKRNMMIYTITFSGRYAQGWRDIKLVNHDKKLKTFIKKEGIANSIPKECQMEVSKCLHMLGKVLYKIMKNEGEEIFSDHDRNVEFSEELRKTLNFDKNVYFEGCQISKSCSNVLPHIDVENCSQDGYRFTGVLSTIQEGVRYTVIGFNRKRATYFMNRKKDALSLIHK